MLELVERISSDRSWSCRGAGSPCIATVALLGLSLAPRIARLHEQTLYKLDRSRRYPHQDPILEDRVKPHLVRRAWDEAVRVVASIHARTASTSLTLHRLGSYARQQSVHQALNEIGPVERTIHILHTSDDEDYRRHRGRELNIGEASTTSRASCSSARKAHYADTGSRTISTRSVAWACCTTQWWPGTRSTSDR